MELGQSIVIGRVTSENGQAFKNFLSLVKEYSELLKTAADAKTKYDSARVADIKRMKRKDYQKDYWEKDEVFDNMDMLLGTQQKSMNEAKKKLDEAWKEYKKDKSLKKIVDIGSKKDLEELVHDALFMKLFQSESFLPTI